MASHASRQVHVQTMPIDEIIERMAVSLEDEFAELSAAYRQFRFAFPNRKNRWLDQLPMLLEKRLRQVLQDKIGYAVWHPYPVAPRDLYKAMRSFICDPTTTDINPATVPLPMNRSAAAN